YGLANAPLRQVCGARAARTRAVHIDEQPELPDADVVVVQHHDGLAADAQPAGSIGRVAIRAGSHVRHLVLVQPGERVQQAARSEVIDVIVGQGDARAGCEGQQIDYLRGRAYQDRLLPCRPQTQPEELVEEAMAG